MDEKQRQSIDEISKLFQNNNTDKARACIINLVESVFELGKIIGENGNSNALISSMVGALQTTVTKSTKSTD